MEKKIIKITDVEIASSVRDIVIDGKPRKSLGVLGSIMKSGILVGGDFQEKWFLPHRYNQDTETLEVAVGENYLVGGLDPALRKFLT